MKKFFTYFSLSIFLAVSIYVVIYMSYIPRTYDGKKTDVYSLVKDNSNYDLKDSDGVASIMVKENLEKTHALNAVSSIVFDYRGYDTLGESFILLTAISGSMVILRARRKKNEKEC